MFFTYSAKIKVLSISLMVLLFSCNETVEDTLHEKPEGFFDYAAFEKDSKQKEYKKIYQDQLYYAADSLNVDSIRSEHMLDHLLKRKTKRHDKGVETFANGAISGEWFERGPTNEAGDLREVDYDPSTDSLYVMSTAGHIYKGGLNGDSWRLLNDQIQFSRNVLNHVKKDGQDRLIALFGSGKDNKRPRYSDDMGATWTLSTGIGEEFYDGWGNPKKIIELGDGKIMYYMVHTWKRTPWGSAIEIYKSTDWGASFSLVLSMNGEGNNYSFDDVDMWSPVDSDNIYVVDNDKKQFYSISTNLSSGIHTLSSPTTITGLGNGQIKLSGRYNNGNPTFYALIDKYMVYKSSNSAGDSWFKRSDVIIDGEAEKAFRNVFMANPDNSQLYMGGFQFYTSNDELTWGEQYSYWWTYYDKNFALPARKNNLHVDMMEMEYFKKSDNTPFFIVLNHAGIYVSYDNMQSTINLAQTGLNVVTLYDHATAADGTIFFGAQDKGTFRNNSDNNSSTGIVESENQTTGDGMRELFFNNGNSWFGFLQNGAMYCMPDKDGSFKRSWQVPGSDIPGWINPVENHPDPAAKKCYVAGGNINGGSGSHLILMEVSWTGSNSNFQWSPSQYEYDFKENSRNGQSVIKALSASKSDYDRLYVATNDGTFFYSTDGGSNWTRSNYDIPTSLVPWDIAVSSTDANHVIMSGTGWSNTGVYNSYDGGQTFTALSGDVPAATFFDIVLSPDEKILYAATSEGPYAYLFDEATWVDLSGVNAPYVDYRSVEYIVATNTLRFGTYGRGVWDFALQTEQPIVDCHKIENGSAYLDYCGDCVGGTTNKEPCQLPYASLVIPGTIEAEAFDYGGEGVSFFDQTIANEGSQLRLEESVDIGDVVGGGFYLGWTATDEWLEYTVQVTESGVYDIDCIVASPKSNGYFHLEIDDNPITSSTNVTATGGWATWETQTILSVPLDEGSHVLKVYIDNTGLNIDRLIFKKAIVSSLSARELSNISVYPNPVRNNKLTVSVPRKSNVNIVDSKGRIKFAGVIQQSETISTSDWTKGTYLVELMIEENKVVKKVVIE